MPKTEPTAKQKMSAKMEAAGLPYDYSDATFASAISPGPYSFPVIAFTEQGTFVGFHGKEEAREVAKTVKRKRGVNVVTIVWDAESF